MSAKKMFDREFYERYRQKGGIYVIPVEIFQMLLIDQETLLEENEELKRQLEEANKKLYLCTPEIPQNVHGEYVSYVDLVNEIYELKKQLEYLRSGEYYNQLRFENEMLQQIVDTNGVPSEVYDYLDCTHRNTELLEQQQKFINYLEDKINFYKNRNSYMVSDIHGNYDLNEIQLEFFEEVVKNYKEIIGNDTNCGSKG